MAVSLFAEARPPGIYKQDYLNELFQRYADPTEPVPVAPPLPTWETEDSKTNRSNFSSTSTKNKFSSNKAGNLSDDDDEDGEEPGQQEEASNNQTANPNKRLKPFNQQQQQRRPRIVESRLNPQFADPNLPGVEACIDPDEISRVRIETQNICGWNGLGFPGAQPVSMDQRNVRFLYEKKYRVSWKADGTRHKKN